MTTTVTLYLATLKQSVLDVPAASEAEQKENERIFDEYSEAYIDYVRGSLASEGFQLEEEGENAGLTYFVEADSAEDEERAHYLMSQGGVQDFWAWYN
ncbi:hypothetical protein GCM10011533_29910 [Streptosporangium jomthongense]|uniref:Uncharacterized protein n=1 Tax=Marinobacter aromaticivorans TaxID=1494078 RepID=A0ABW2IYS5_9GAMM|nr:hypothetical protein [Marinobacter aromaticivorans]GGE75544.1 hypothetical protein GCM10011533_29910 [Streptosporangium jomthongense]